jgi:apolipoprotein N-acyltransferase
MILAICAILFFVVAAGFWWVVRRVTKLVATLLLIPALLALPAVALVCFYAMLRYPEWLEPRLWPTVIGGALGAIGVGFLFAKAVERGWR